MRLAAYFRTEPAFWMQLQIAWDVHQAMKTLRSRESVEVYLSIRRSGNRHGR